MAQPPDSERDPQVDAELRAFEEGDFHVLSPSLARDPQYNDRRLVVRRKLLALAKTFAERVKANGLDIEVRTSLHAPSSFNHNQVKRIWAYACRTKAEKKRLKGEIGADLAKDLDAAYRNAYLCAALETDAIEVSLRIHAEAWFDGQNLVNRTKAEGVAGWAKLLNELDGFTLRLADWKGEWVCGKLGRDRLDEFLGYYKPAEHLLRVEKRWPAPAGARQAALASHVPEEIVRELARLVPLYRFTSWSRESDFLFKR